MTASASASASDSEDVSDPRTYIDRIDRTIVALLTERRRLRDADGPLSDSSAERIFGVIDEETRAVRP